MPGVYAQFDTTEGNFTVRLYDEEAPKTVENFVGLAEGTKEWTDPRTNQKVKKPYYDGVDLPPRDRRLHDPGRRSARTGHRRPRLHVRGRVPSRSCGTTRPGILSMANRGAEHQRRPVLHHARADAAPRRPALRVRRGRRRHGRGEEDRQHADRASATGRSRTSSSSRSRSSDAEVMGSGVIFRGHTLKDVRCVL